MRILDRYIVREVFRHALLGLAVFSFVFFVPQLVRLMELFVRHSGSGAQIFELFLCIFPGVFTFTIPMAVLIGVLLGLGRMSADSEIIALTALGIGRRRILLPVGVLAVGGAFVTLCMTLWLGPMAVHKYRSLETELLASQVSFAVQPRVFDERFPKLVLYVNDVSASGTQWHGVFLAEAGGENGSQLTLAENAIVIAEPKEGKLELHLKGGSTHEFSREDPDRYSVTSFGQSDWPLEVNGLVPAQPRELSNSERSLQELLNAKDANWREARVELHRRLAFPVACLAFALIAVPLGAQPRRGGRAAGSLIAVIIIASYYLLTVIGAGFARQGTLPPSAGIWGANILLAILGLALLPRMEQFRGESRWMNPLVRFRSWARLLRRRKARARAAAIAVVRIPNGIIEPHENGVHTSGSFPRLMDIYLLRRFFFISRCSWPPSSFLFETFTFFELLDDIARHRVPFLIVVDYFRYLTPYLVYNLAPLAALVAVLVTLGVMSKNNEIVACKASGISLYRLAVPLLFAGLALAASMIVLDETYLPYANQRQDALRNQIKGRPAQTYAHPQRWIFGNDEKIYNYDLFDPTQNLFGGLSVVELDPATFQMRRRIFATRAHMVRFTESLGSGGRLGARFRRWHHHPLRAIPGHIAARAIRAAELFQSRGTPGFPNELGRAAPLHRRSCSKAGFDVANLTVQWHVKLAFPLIAPVSMLLAIPFALLVGTRGAVGGVALGVAIGIVYWTAARLLEAMGGVGQLPPFLAAWSTDITFFFLGLYFFFKMPT